MIETILRKFYQPIQSPVWLAYSGGIDSHVLAHATARLCLRIPITLVHVNHHIEAAADAWQAHCTLISAALGLPLRVLLLTGLSAKMSNLEAKARIARYQAFASLMQEGDYLLTAHHENDQAETVLMNLCRGSGLKGLGAMQSHKSWSKGWLARPFLTISKAMIQAYALTHQLSWVEDTSNALCQRRRNWLRHRVLPLLETVYPKVTKALAQTAAYCQHAYPIVQTIMNQKLQDIAGTQLPLALLKPHDALYRQGIIRTWIQNNKILLPSSLKLKHLLDQVFSAAASRNPLLAWSKAIIYRYQHCLYLYPLDYFSKYITYPYQPVPWVDVSRPVRLSPYRALTIKWVEQGGVALSYLTQHRITIGFRQGGERCQLEHRGHTHSLKKLFQAWLIPWWMRNSIPLLYIDGVLAAVVGHCYCEPFVSKAGGFMITVEDGSIV